MDVLSALIFLSGLLLAYLLLRRISEAGYTGPDASQGTEILPSLYMYQLDPKTMAQDKHFELNDVVMQGDGYTISGSNGRNGMLKLSGRFQEARWISDEHATVFMDLDGYYIQDNGSTNGTRLPNSSRRETKIRIENGMVIYLGLQPIQFVFVDNTGRDLPDIPDSDSVNGSRVNVREKPRRRNAPARRR